VIWLVLVNVLVDVLDPGRTCQCTNSLRGTGQALIWLVLVNVLVEVPG
jgi:hypothetical protein